MHSFDLDAIASGLPASALIPQLSERHADAAAGLRAVITAPPGTGKTTVVPPALAGLLPAGRIIVTQPRRLAARAAARRLAQLSGTRLGEAVGYTVRGDAQVSRSTRIEFVTTGVLLRRMLADPGLEGVTAIVLDEVHERHLDSDLAAALAVDATGLRADLTLVAMSATLEAERWAELIGGPVLNVTSALHPVEIRCHPGPGRPTNARGITSEFLTHMAGLVESALRTEATGDALVFMPAIRDVEALASLLRGRVPADVRVLTGSTSATEQDAILTPRTDLEASRRVVVSTSVAESALTVPGVRIVVDSCLARVPHFDTGRGFAGLATVRASKAACTQRAGRAGRLGPGLAIRALSEADYAALPAHTPPEVRTADLTSAILDLACWGAPFGHGLRLPDPLPERPAAQAAETLRLLGALDDTGAATARGRQLARIPADPRMARGLLDGAEFVGAAAAAEVVAALASDLRCPGADAVAAVRQLRRASPRTYTRETARLTRILAETTGEDTCEDTAVGTTASGQVPLDEAVATVIALAYPDRIARLRPGSEDKYLLASGTGATLPREAQIRGHEWLAVAEVSLAGQRALIRAATPLDRETAELLASDLYVTETATRFDGRKLSARRIERLGAIELSATPVKADPDAGAEAVAAFIRERGLREVIAENPGFAQLRGRLGLLHAVFGGPWPDVRFAALESGLAEWCHGELTRVAAGASATGIDWASALRNLLPWPEAGRFDELAPERIEVPSGSTVRLRYPAPEDHGDSDADPADAEIAAPVLAVKLQECFGWQASPVICDGRVPVLMHLLSPAARPLAVTADLASFWQQGYPGVRAENRGRYIKHPWPEDPLTAPPARGTKRSGR
ncbi:ATP-dependent helicase HrpB [Brevibacterium sp. p3-SID960]|uniref:ATP-dependent helicase HrpB n=1 Tax=Brevibacterium sp. p3-SID960 TaxID=2916063 RepID=UPI0021A378C2|nr:ATP-dependent helicase HrpB [Brevibacterium sp. p3-SID960]MCT1691134.1 ATP-dependent helicase HrpB [Brevibacterium sp. p3-SID960]